MPVQSRCTINLQQIRTSSASARLKYIDYVVISHAQFRVRAVVRRGLTGTTFLIVIDNILIHRVPQFLLANNSIGVARRYCEGLIILHTDTSVVEGSSYDIRPVPVGCTLEHKFKLIVDRLGGIVDGKVEELALNAVTSIGKEPGRIGGGIAGVVPSERIYSANGETYTAVKPRQARRRLEL